MNLRRRDLLLAAGVCITFGARAFAQPSAPRRLLLKNAHTGETFNGPYRDGDGPIPAAMSDLAAFLRDFHADKVGPIHVETLDFLADVLDAVGQSQATILSAYRTPETNALLRATMFGVAEKSQHLYGRALDLALDRRLKDAEQVALRLRRGGVGWYPRSHFIHIDSGPVRSWEMDGSGLDMILAGHAPHRMLTVKERLKLHSVLARRQYMQRHGG